MGDERDDRRSILDRYMEARGLAGDVAKQSEPGDEQGEDGIPLLAIAGSAIGGSGAGLLIARLYYRFSSEVDLGYTVSIVAAALMALGVALAVRARPRVSGATRVGSILFGALVGVAIGSMLSRVPTAESVELTPEELPGFRLSLPDGGERTVFSEEEVDGRIAQEFVAGGRRGAVVVGWQRADGVIERGEMADLAKVAFSVEGEVISGRDIEGDGYYGYSGTLAVQNENGSFTMVQCEGSDLSVQLMTIYNADPGTTDAIHQRIASSLECTATGSMEPDLQKLPHVELPPGFGRANVQGRRLLASWRGEAVIFDVSGASRVPADKVAGGILSGIAQFPGIELLEGPSEPTKHRTRGGATFEMVHMRVSENGVETGFYAGVMYCLAPGATFLNQYIVESPGPSARARAIEVLSHFDCPRADSPRFSELPPAEKVFQDACDTGTAEACAALETEPSSLPTGP